VENYLGFICQKCCWRDAL